MSVELLKSLAGVDVTVVRYRGTPQAMTTPVRSRLLPDLPTLNEAGVAGYDATAWRVIYVPADTPPPIRQALKAAAQRALADPAMRRRLGEIGVGPFADSSAAAARAYLEAEVAKWATLVRSAGIRGG